MSGTGGGELSTGAGSGSGTGKGNYGAALTRQRGRASDSTSIAPARQSRVGGFCDGFRCAEFKNSHGFWGSKAIGPSIGLVL